MSSSVLLLAVAVPGTLLMALITRWFGWQCQMLVYMLTGNRTAAIYAYYVLVLPGTLLHELSHWIIARLLGVRVGGLSLTPIIRNERQVQFGAVTVSGAGHLRASLIGLAPLALGTAIILLLAARFGLNSATLSSQEGWQSAWQTLHNVPDAWLRVYLILAISNTMFPSASDRASWGIVALWAGALLAALYLTGLWSRVDIASSWVRNLAQSLALVYLMTAALDLTLGSLLWLLQQGLGLVLGRRLIVE